MSLISLLVNVMFSSADRKRDAGLETPADITRHDNLSYGPFKQWSLLDVYHPAENPGRLPVIVNIHGGGWVYGSKEVYQFYCMSLAQRGFAVVNFNYRLAPASKFPAPLEDTNAVIRWIFAHAGEYPFDLDNIFLVGDSAGANTAALYGALCTNPAFARQFSIQPPAGFVPRAVALNCGVYDAARAVENSRRLFGGLLKDYLGRRPTSADLERINACSAVSATFPPTFLMTAEYDMVNYQAPLLLEKLEAQGVPHEYHVYGAGKKEVGHVFHCNMRLPEAAQCNDDTCAFFRKAAV